MSKINGGRSGDERLDDVVVRISISGAGLGGEAELAVGDSSHPTSGMCEAEGSP